MVRSLKLPDLFLKWIGMNYRLNLRESRFQDALVTYVNVILECSVRGNYTLKEFVFFICYFEKTFSYYGFTCSTFPYFESQTFLFEIISFDEIFGNIIYLLVRKKWLNSNLIDIQK